MAVSVQNFKAQCCQIISPLAILDSLIRNHRQCSDLINKKDAFSLYDNIVILFLTVRAKMSFIGGKNSIVH